MTTPVAPEDGAYTLERKSPARAKAFGLSVALVSIGDYKSLTYRILFLDIDRNRLGRYLSSLCLFSVYRFSIIHFPNMDFFYTEFYGYFRVETIEHH
jgi:hypothetical protein